MFYDPFPRILSSHSVVDPHDVGVVENAQRRTVGGGAPDFRELQRTVKDTVCETTISFRTRTVELRDSQKADERDGKREGEKGEKGMRWSGACGRRM